MPPTMMNGVVSAGTEANVAATISRHVARGYTGYLRRTAYTCTVAICAPAISSPGITPARYSAPIDVEITPPHTTIRIDGGMITASTADTAVIAMENDRSYPSRVCASMKILLWLA